MDFNETKATYRHQIENTIAFAGQGLDFYTRVKARYLREIVARHLPQCTSPRLLDVGCGHGYIHPELVRHGYQVVGLEVAEEVLPLAREANPAVTYLAYDGQTLPFDDASFDVVTAICVMHHVPPQHWQGLAREMRRILRPGGVAAIFEHNPYNPATRYVVANSPIDDDAVLLSSPTLKNLLKTAGFSQVVARSILFTPFEGQVFEALDRYLGWLPLGAQYYALGTAR
jgi:SAM-dependent methyltransferase